MQSKINCIVYTHYTPVVDLASVLVHPIPPSVDDDLILVLAFLVFVKRYPSCEISWEN